MGGRLNHFSVKKLLQIFATGDGIALKGFTSLYSLKILIGQGILVSGFSRGTVSKIENGLVNPQIWTLQMIAKTIGVPFRAFDDSPTITQKRLA